jgi:hypothetical protein
VLFLTYFAPERATPDDLFAVAMGELRRRELVTGKERRVEYESFDECTKSVGPGLLIRKLWRNDGGEVHFAVAVRDAASDPRICHLLDAVDTLR